MCTHEEKMGTIRTNKIYDNTRNTEHMSEKRTIHPNCVRAARNQKAEKEEERTNEKVGISSSVVQHHTDWAESSQQQQQNSHHKKERK